MRELGQGRNSPKFIAQSTFLCLRLECGEEVTIQVQVNFIARESISMAKRLAPISE